MTIRRKTAPSQEYEVGYGKPPLRTRFRAGQSGNPGGRPRGMTLGRTYALTLKEIFRPLKLREGDKVRRMPTYQALWRRLIAAAAEGKGPALRLFFERAHAVEEAIAVQMAAKQNAGGDTPEILVLEAARRVAFLLNRAQHELQRQKAEASSSAARP